MASSFRAAFAASLGLLVAASLSADPAPPAIDIPALKREVSEIRGLPFKEEFKTGALTKEELRGILVEEIDREASAEDFREDADALRLLGLVDGTFDFRRTLLDLATSQVGGIYLPRRKSLFYVRDFEGMARAILSHEIQHALQDQHIDIEKGDRDRKGDGDRSLAFHALLEGEAMEVMAAYVARNPGAAALSMEEAARAMAGSLDAGGAPPFLMESMTMPYIQGHLFAKALRAAGGWKRLDEALADPPASTEQVLHPEKYLTRSDPPIGVRLPDLAPALGAGWTRLDEDIYGEWMIATVIRSLTGDPVKGARAASGWGGDRYALYGKGADRAFAWGSVWDAEKDAREFETYLKDALGRRPPPAVPARIFRREAEAFVLIGPFPEEVCTLAAKLFESRSPMK